MKFTIRLMLMFAVLVSGTIQPHQILSSICDPADSAPSQTEDRIVEYILHLMDCRGSLLLTALGTNRNCYRALAVPLLTNRAPIPESERHPPLRF
jgi:hypothetical protein